MSVSLKPIKEQVFVITGASSGIGLATALAAGRQGAKVVLAARSADTLLKTVDEMLSGGATAVCIAADVSVRHEVQKIADTALARFGRIDTWVNDAGVSIYGRLDEVTEEDSRRLFDINFRGVRQRFPGCPPLPQAKWWRPHQCGQRSFRCCRAAAGHVFGIETRRERIHRRPPCRN